MHKTRREFVSRAGAIVGASSILGVGGAGIVSAEHGIEIGGVVHTAGVLYVRDGPGLQYGVIDTKPEALRGTVKDGPVSANGYTWWSVLFDDDRYDDGSAVWCAEIGNLQPGSEHTTTFSLYDGVHATTHLNVRDSPSTTGNVVDTTAPGDTGTIVEGPVEADGYTWWRVEYHDNGNGWSVENWLDESAFLNCRSEWDDADNRWALAKIITSEAGYYLTSGDARRAVAYSVLNRMERNGTTRVTDEWDAYAYGQDPTPQSLDLAERVLRCEATDTSGGATHFYSPRSMPKEGEDTSNNDTSGGLERTPGLDRRNYRPGWALEFTRTYVPGAAQKNFKFFRQPGDGQVF